MFKKVAEVYRSRTYRRALTRPLDLKSRRHTGDDTLPLRRKISYQFYEIRASINNIFEFDLPFPRLVLLIAD